KAPTMKKILPPIRSRIQFYFHLGAVSGILLTSILMQEGAFENFAVVSGRFSAGLMILSSFLLLLNLVSASRFYFKFMSGMAKDNPSVLN
ncbi:MAG: hypothetical protein OEZ34_11190, partial [Spirochaetia bacterium]|nr:hypothetical protein [Spirochaetia bacterium]